MTGALWHGAVAVAAWSVAAAARPDANGELAGADDVDVILGTGGGNGVQTCLAANGKAGHVEGNVELDANGKQLDVEVHLERKGDVVPGTSVANCTPGSEHVEVGQQGNEAVQGDGAACKGN